MCVCLLCAYIILLFTAAADNVDSQSTLWDRCNYKEHGSAYGSLGHQKTEYFQVLRIVYHQVVSPAGGAGAAGGAGEVIPKKLFYKVFTPLQLRRALSLPSEEVEPLVPLDGHFEDLRQLEDKANAWLSYSGEYVLLKTDVKISWVYLVGRLYRSIIRQWVHI